MAYSIVPPTLLVCCLAGAVQPAAARAGVQGDATGTVIASVPEAHVTIARVVVLDPDSIVARAIARRRDVLAQIGRVRYEAWVKYVARDLNPKRDTARSVLFLSETRSTAYWEPHRHYQEIVDARRQSRGFGPPRSLVAVDDIVDVNRTTIVLGGYASPGRGGEGGEGGERRGGGRSRSYVVPSPIGRGAFDRYDFQLLDTLTVDGRRAYRLAVIPRSSTTPLFVGTIEVADSTFDVLAMDLGLNDAVRFGSVRNLRYREISADAGEGRWLPSQVRLSGEVRPRITAEGLPRELAGVPIPGLPEEVDFEQVAALGSFRFGEGDRPPGLGEYRVIVRNDADRPDTATWNEPGAVPLTDAERAVWARSDSAERHPPVLIRIGQGIGAVGEVASNPGYFHFNRVDGYYLGVAPTWRAAPGLILDTKLGYALGSRTWQYRFGGEVQLSQGQRMWLGASYGDETVSHPTLISSRYNPTFRALFARVDPLDYYRERGFNLALRTKLLDLTQLELGYKDARQWSLDTVPGYSFHSTRYPPRGNPSIAPGLLRAVSATLIWDSRQMVRSGERDFRLNPTSWTRLTAGVEVAAPSVLPDDFSYRRYQVQIERAQPLFGWGTTTISAVGGIATGWVPPQRYFTVDFGMDFLAVEGSAFSTVSRTNYYGNRAAVLTVRHDFDRILFARSGLPLIRTLPFTLSVQGGLFWADFVNHVTSPADSMLATAPTPYTEVGFSLGNLTPFLSPFNFSATFAWQLSSYATRRFRFQIGLTGP